MQPPAPPIDLIADEPLARHTTWRIGGPARSYGEVRSVAEARDLAAWAAAQALPLIWVGGGTNLLALDSGFPGVVARYRGQNWSIEEHGDSALLIIEAGAPMAGTARRIGAMGWAGLTWAEGVPGTVGGAVFGNAGCYGGDIAGILERVTVLVDGAVQEWPAARMGYGYRTSALKERAVHRMPPLILAATLRLTRADPAALQAEMARIAAERKGKTPWGSSCGSVFKNPPGDSAGRLIEAAGLKGRRVGGAEISPKHANYIVNVDNATSHDVLSLIDIARETVLQQFGVALELEVRIVPSDGDR
jgi:UDP-N-acetylmuramate dehydrogenase